LWVISALPGVSAERMEVRIEGSELVITGNRPLPKCCEDGELKIWEIPLGRFERRIRLTRADKRVAVGKTTLQDGLLIIEIRNQS
jgi:HSP20 family molecular chaperone IbpA